MFTRLKDILLSRSGFCFARFITAVEFVGMKFEGKLANWFLITVNYRFGLEITSMPRITYARELVVVLSVLKYAADHSPYLLEP